MLDAADTDNDGRISFEEFRAHMKGALQKRISLYPAQNQGAAEESKDPDTEESKDPAKH